MNREQFPLGEYYPYLESAVIGACLGILLYGVFTAYIGGSHQAINIISSLPAISPVDHNPEGMIASFVKGLGITGDLDTMMIQLQKGGLPDLVKGMFGGLPGQLAENVAPTILNGVSIPGQ